MNNFRVVEKAFQTKKSSSSDVECAHFADVRATRATQSGDDEIEELPSRSAYESTVFETTPTPSTVRRFKLRNHPGLVILTDALTTRQQLLLADVCLNAWSEPPNKSNLTARYGEVHSLVSDNACGCCAKSSLHFSFKTRLMAKT
jgi:hypothetical protein